MIDETNYEKQPDVKEVKNAKKKFTDKFIKSSLKNTASELVEKFKPKTNNIGENVGDIIAQLKNERDKEEDEGRKKDIDDIIRILEDLFKKKFSKEDMIEDLKRRLQNPILLKKAQELARTHPEIVEMAKKMLGSNIIEELDKQYGVTPKAIAEKQKQNSWVRKL